MNEFLIHNSQFTIHNSQFLSPQVPPVAIHIQPLSGLRVDSPWQNRDALFA
jgi:hypothetical protein